MQEKLTCCGRMVEGTASRSNLRCDGWRLERKLRFRVDLLWPGGAPPLRPVPSNLPIVGNIVGKVQYFRNLTAYDRHAQEKKETKTASV